MAFLRLTRSQCTAVTILGCCSLVACYVSWVLLWSSSDDSLDLDEDSMVTGLATRGEMLAARMKSTKNKASEEGNDRDDQDDEDDDSYITTPPPAVLPVEKHWKDLCRGGPGRTSKRKKRIRAHDDEDQHSLVWRWQFRSAKRESVLIFPVSHSHPRARVRNAIELPESTNVRQRWTLELELLVALSGMEIDNIFGSGSAKANLVKNDHSFVTRLQWLPLAAIAMQEEGDLSEAEKILKTLKVRRNKMTRPGGVLTQEAETFLCENFLLQPGQLIHDVNRKSSSKLLRRHAVGPANCDTAPGGAFSRKHLSRRARLDAMRKLRSCKRRLGAEFAELAPETPELTSKGMELRDKRRRLRVLDGLNFAYAGRSTKHFDEFMEQAASVVPVRDVDAVMPSPDMQRAEKLAAKIFREHAAQHPVKAKRPRQDPDDGDEEASAQRKRGDFAKAKRDGGQEKDSRPQKPSEAAHDEESENPPAPRPPQPEEDGKEETDQNAIAAPDETQLAKEFYQYDFGGSGNTWVATPFAKTSSADIDPLAAKVIHGQAGQDWLVQSLLNCKENGTFIELGSHHASVLSNSLLLEKKFNWQGLCLEADPQYLPGYRQRKNCKLVQNLVGYPTGRTIEFAAFHSKKSNGLSGIVGDTFDNTDENEQESYGVNAVVKKVVALEDVWRHFQFPTTIDYFSLDVEGAESFVMEHFPWETLRFRVLTVERAKPDLQSLLRQQGYRKVRKNAWFEDTTWVDTREIDSETSAKFANGEPIGETCMVKAGFPRPTTLDT